MDAILIAVFDVEAWPIRAGNLRLDISVSFVLMCTRNLSNWRLICCLLKFDNMIGCNIISVIYSICQYLALPLLHLGEYFVEEGVKHGTVLRHVQWEILASNNRGQWTDGLEAFLLVL